MALAHLDGISIDFRVPLREGLVTAYVLGRSHGVEQLLLDPDVTPAPAPEGELPTGLVHSVNTDTGDSVDRVIAQLDQQLELARKAFEGEALSLDDIDIGVAAVRRIEKRAEAGVITAVHGQINAGTASVVESPPAGLAVPGTARAVWLAERDACVHCLALSGHVRKGPAFPWGLTFPPAKPLKKWKELAGPPLHPHCRCQLVLWNGVDTGGAGLNFPDSLRREAKRSVIKGWALPTESQTLRQRAASALLAAGAGLPPSVEARARAAVRSKKFRTRRAP